MSFCTNCGNAVSDGNQFCTNCGARQTPVQVASAVSPIAPAAQVHPPQPENFTATATATVPQWQPVPQAVQPLTPVKAKSALPFILVVLGVLAIIAAVLIGGMVYVGYRVKQKVPSVAKLVTEHAPTPARDVSPAAPAPSTEKESNPDVSS